MTWTDSALAPLSFPHISLLQFLPPALFFLGMPSLVTSLDRPRIVHSHARSTFPGSVPLSPFLTHKAFSNSSNSKFGTIHE